MNVYYVADVRRVLGKSPVAPAGVNVRTSTEADVSALADLYRRAYHPASVTLSASEMPDGVGFTGRESAPYSEGLSIIRLLAGRQVDSRTECAGSASPAGRTPGSH